MNLCVGDRDRSSDPSVRVRTGSNPPGTLADRPSGRVGRKLRPHGLRSRLGVGCVLLAATTLTFAFAACGGDSVRPKQPLIVYESRDAQKATNVWTVDADTRAAKQLTFGTRFDGNPGWSPDHARIIFSSDRDSDPGENDLYTMSASGGDVRRLTNTPDVSEWSAKFSPDGKRVVYVANTNDGWHLSLAGADGSDQQHVAGPYKFAEFPSWRRDGVEVYFSAIAQDRNDADIYSYDMATHAVQTRISTPAADVCPHFTRNGQTLIYATAAPGDEKNIDLFAHDLSSDDASGAHDVRLTDDPGVDDYGNPSPDDKSIVFISNREAPGETYSEDPNAPSAANNDLYLMDRDGKHQRRLTDTPDARENVPDW